MVTYNQLAWREFFNESPKAQLLQRVNAQAKGQAEKVSSLSHSVGERFGAMPNPPKGQLG
jgi:hypothetical protein